MKNGRAKSSGVGICRVPKYITMTILMSLMVIGCSSHDKNNYTATPNDVDNMELVNALNDLISQKTIDFVEVPISKQKLIDLDKTFKTISIKEFQLNSHKLYKITFHNKMLFEFNSSSTKNIKFDDVREFIKLYKSNEIGQKLFVLGHTDSVGEAVYNQSLSARRAWSIANVLAKNGVDTNAINLVPAGESMPLFSNLLDKGRSLNRRVEVFSANSKALVESYLRQVDCKKIDPACVKVSLPILSLKKSGRSGFILKDTQKRITTSSPELNQLIILDRELSKNIKAADSRYSVLLADKKRNSVKVKNRGSLTLPISIRKAFDSKLEIRKSLLLPNKYLLENWE